MTENQAPRSDDGRKFRKMQLEGSLPLSMRRCGARVGSTYYEFPLGGCEIYVDSIRITTLFGSYRLPFTSIREATLEREFFLKWIQLKHTADGVPELAIWTFRIESFAADIRSLIRTNCLLPDQK